MWLWITLTWVFSFQKLSIESQLTWIYTKFQSTDCTTDPNFIRHLTTVVIENCCDEYPGSTTAQPSYKLQNARLGDLSQLLQRYIDNETTRELQCINALQNFALDREYPSGKSQKPLKFWNIINFLLFFQDF